MASVKRLIFSLFVCVLSLLAADAGTLYHPQGRLIEPPPRLSLWRHGYDAPEYSQDNELSCYTRKEKKGSNKKSQALECGLCGETSLVAKNLQTAKSDNAVTIVRSYQQGQKIKVGVLLITPTVRRGWFQFDLCPKCKSNDQETEHCFARHILKVLSMSRVDPSQPIETRLAAASENIPDEERALSEEIDILIEREDVKRLYSIPPGLPPDTVLVIELHIPSDVSCDACVLRWKYFAGKHQRLYGCADVRITASSDQTTHSPWIYPDCMPEGTQPRDEDVVVVRRRDQMVSNKSDHIAALDSRRGHRDSLSVKSSSQIDGVKERETTGSLNRYPEILSRIVTRSPNVDNQELEEEYDDSFTDSMAKLTEIESNAAFAVRNLTLPSSLYFFISSLYFLF